MQAHLLPLETPDRCRVLFSVSDTGQGIADGMIEHIFETFTQANMRLILQIPESMRQQVWVCLWSSAW